MAASADNVVEKVEHGKHWEAWVQNAMQRMSCHYWIQERSRRWIQQPGSTVMGETSAENSAIFEYFLL